MTHKFFLLTALLSISLWMAGCATTEYHPLPGTIDTHTPPARPPVKKEGIYHKVDKGQTLFRIAKAYGVDMDEVIAANNIPNAGSIEVNQLILIPGAKEVKTIPVVSTPSLPVSTTSKPNDDAVAVDLNKDEFAWPLRGKVVSYYNDKKADATNKGIDIEASMADPIKAAREGKVILSDYVGSWGYTVMIDHGDGFISVYSQLGQTSVKPGEIVYKGNAIGQLGQKGNKSILHFQIRKGSIAVNPLYYLP